MNDRKYILSIFVVISGIILVIRLIYLQLWMEKYVNPLENAAVTARYIYPNRGLIYDRHGHLLVSNQVSYDVMVIPGRVALADTMEFCRMLSITKEQFLEKIDKARRYSPVLPSVFISQLDKDDYALVRERMYKYEGFYFQKRNLREYPESTAANVLGYISEVTQRMIRENPGYQMGELIGYQGVEKQYEEVLKGQKGVRYYSRNRYNLITGSYKDGAYDRPAVAGKDLTLTLDLELQKYGEKLMKNKRGGIVAIEPASGEILALVTAPSYDPNLMVGRKRSENFNRMYYDSVNKPLLDRALQAQYSPGSTFKPLVGLIALQEGVITPHSIEHCYGGFKYGKRAEAFMGCHCGTFGAPVDLVKAIYKSCNTYFSKAYKKSIEKYGSAHSGMDHWSRRVKAFGLGNYLGYDLPIGQKGNIPDAAYYDRYYPAKNWKAATTISNAIGQGEILATPIQLANMTAAIANRGYFYTPHIVKEIEGKPIRDTRFTEPKHTGIDSLHFEPVIEGMSRVFGQGGTAYYSRVEGISMCGKTGTVENFIRVNGEKIPLTDHSLFIAFAPRNHPEIAIAVFIENGGFGSTVAAPVASLMIEKYLKGTADPIREERVLSIDLYEREYNHIQKLISGESE